MTEADKTAEPTIGQLVADASRDVSSLVQYEIALAKSELKFSLKAGGVGAGLLAAVGVLALIIIVLLSVTAGYFLGWVFDRDIPLSYTWGFLIVTGFWILLAIILALVGIRMLKKVRGPEKTIATAKEIPPALKGKHKTDTAALEARVKDSRSATT